MPMKLISHEARKSPNGERKAGHTGRNASRSGPRARNSVKPCAPSLCGGSEIDVGPDGGAGKEGRVTTMTRTPRQDCVDLFRDDLRTGSGASGFPSGERGIGTAESTARIAQMITVPRKRLAVRAGEKSRNSLRLAKT